MRRDVFVLKGMNFLWRTWLLPLLTSGSHTGFSISQSSLLRSLMHRGFPTLRNVLMTLVKDQKMLLNVISLLFLSVPFFAFFVCIFAVDCRLHYEGQKLSSFSIGKD